MSNSNSKRQLAHNQEERKVRAEKVEGKFGMSEEDAHTRTQSQEHIKP